jgi:putative flippase GtrA
MSNTEGSDSSILQKGIKFVQFTLKYGSTSIIATSVDFTTFGLVNPFIGVVYSTIIGRSVGATIAFLLHRKWVFKAAQIMMTKRFIFKYLIAILMGMGLNVLGVWFLSNILSINEWTSRIVTAVTVWGFIFLFNKYFVFTKKIVDFEVLEVKILRG